MVRSDSVQQYEFTPKGVCAKKMIFDIEDNYIRNVEIIGGCPGNSLGICLLVKDQPIDEIIEKLQNIKCGFKATSCPAQLAQGLREYKKNN